MNEQQLQDSICQTLEKKLGTTINEATSREIYIAVSSIVKENLNSEWLQTTKRYKEQNPRTVYYFSMEFLMGRLLESNLLNMHWLEPMKAALTNLGFVPEDIFACEQDAGLGNGGLGRLAACFLDSMASLQIPGHGYGIRYKYGLFEQKIVDGNQVELPDYWLREPYVWETKRPDLTAVICFGGRVETYEENGKMKVSLLDTEKVAAVPYDVPIKGYNNETINTLRLWSAEPLESEDGFYAGDKQSYYDHLESKRSLERISEFLYPDDSNMDGKMLRLKQQYFLVSSGLQTIVKLFKQRTGHSCLKLHEYISIQINDTHPSLVVPELMRLLMDEEGLGWDEAWHVTTNTVAYTNHTILSEALEKWPVPLFSQLLPRIYMITEEINERFCQMVYHDHPEYRSVIHELAVISYGQVRMAHLAVVGSYSVNGVAKMHTEILKRSEMKQFYGLFPGKFNNKTNGITHRRWLMQANPELTSLINSSIGEEWKERPKDLIKLLRYSKDASFQEKLFEVKQFNKQNLARYIKEKTGLIIDDRSIFDVQIKRLHGYKRQLLNILYVINRYLYLKDHPHADIPARTFIFGAKAAPSYHFAKQVIRLIVSAADQINNDASINDKIKIVFLENYNVSLAEMIIPASEVSQQISTAGKEASGTGNMKLMMNGALTLGTLDGANVEIKDMVGSQNMFLFGMEESEIEELHRTGGYSAKSLYQSDKRLHHMINQLHDGFFGRDELAFKDIYYHLLRDNDEYFVLKDFESYVEAQEMIDQTYQQWNKWQEMSITNIAHSGKFSSDRTIMQYASEIWNISPYIPVPAKK
ncbi:starch phosphorylase [Sinobaca qinghaiensis]|uniref:Alpha-1,4 glucan phosphorylase n=1 Tax=Sinobaca qinghaiensis TaxID=342944 RepID=A0A419V435_9BACL|nr:glycogen/starch/alpha-glucan phosphorylase [Sinobaca qinghaiensis]RKD73181.1 starch phosphorylase [Sinobaca qinghaiensis]